MSDDFRPLSPLQAIRHRPDMYVRADATGSISDHLLCASLCHFLAELSCGTASALSIIVENLNVTISDNGAGWPTHFMPDGRRYAETMLSEMYACRDIKAHTALAHDLCQISLPVVVALSESFTLDIHRDGSHWRQTYRAGVAGSPLQIIGPSSGSGTSIHYTLDVRLCGHASISEKAFRLWLSTLGSSIPINAIDISFC